MALVLQTNIATSFSKTEEEKNWLKKFRRQETLTLLTDADKNTNTTFLLIKKNKK